MLSTINYNGGSPEAYAQLLTTQKWVFASKIQLHRGRDCFKLIAEVIIDDDKVALSDIFALF